jgi:Xaa-Pro aminopeptidase
MFEVLSYATRRKALVRRVSSGCVLLPGNDMVGMNYSANQYPFRQDGSFAYFVGIDRPGLFLWIDCESGEEGLFGVEPDIMHTIWSGPSPSLGEMAAASGMGRHGSLTDLAELCRDAMNKGRTVHYLPPYQGDGVLRLSRFLGLSPDEVEAGSSRALIEVVVDLRSVKSAEEVEHIRQAVTLSADMYADLMACLRPGVGEMELYGRMQGLVLSRGGHEAFPMILSRRGEVLHNHTHDQILAEGDMLLVDSGVCSSLGYASDITRTLPVGGRFTPRQRDIYEIVLRSQAVGMACMAPACRSWTAIWRRPGSWSKVSRPWASCAATTPWPWPREPTPCSAPTDLGTCWVWTCTTWRASARTTWGMTRSSAAVASSASRACAWPAGCSPGSC